MEQMLLHGHRGTAIAHVRPDTLTPLPYFVLSTATTDPLLHFKIFKVDSFFNSRKISWMPRFYKSIRNYERNTQHTFPIGILVLRHRTMVS